MSVTDPGSKLLLEVLQTKTVLAFGTCSAESFSFIKGWSLSLCFLDFPAVLCMCMSLFLL